MRFDLTKAEAAAARLADNKVSEGDFDTNILQEELRWLAEESIDLCDLGFDDRELNFLMEDLGEMSSDLLVEYRGISEEMPDVSGEDEHVEDLTESRVPLAKVFGVKDVSASQARVLTRFLALVSHGEPGVNGLVRHAEETLFNA